MNIKDAPGVNELRRGQLLLALGLVLDIGAIGWGAIIAIVLVTDPAALLTTDRVVALLGMGVVVGFAAFAFFVSGLVLFTRGTVASTQYLTWRLLTLEQTVTTRAAAEPTRPA